MKEAEPSLAESVEAYIQDPVERGKRDKLLEERIKIASMFVQSHFCYDNESNIYDLEPASIIYFFEEWRERFIEIYKAVEEAPYMTQLFRDVSIGDVQNYLNNHISDTPNDTDFMNKINLLRSNVNEAVIISQKI